MFSMKWLVAAAAFPAMSSAFMGPAPASLGSKQVAIRGGQADCSARGLVMAAQSPLDKAGTALAGFALASGLLMPLAADAGFQFPPIDKTDKTRCTFKSSAIGQANAARDKLYDLRECEMSGRNAAGFDVAGAIMVGGDFSKVNFKEATMSKVFANEAKFDGADFSNAIMDRGTYKGSSFKGAILSNTVLSGSSFEGADLSDTDFSDAYLGEFDQRNLCKNPTLKGTNPTTGADTRMSAACRK